MRKQDIIRKTIKGIIKGDCPSAELMRHCLEVNSMKHLANNFIIRQIYDQVGKDICNQSLPYGITCNLSVFLIRAGGYMPSPMVTPYEFLVNEIYHYNLLTQLARNPPMNLFQ